MALRQMLTVFQSALLGTLIALTMVKGAFANDQRTQSSTSVVGPLVAMYSNSSTTLRQPQSSTSNAVSSTYSSSNLGLTATSSTPFSSETSSPPSLRPPTSSPSWLSSQSSENVINHTSVPPLVTGSGSVSKNSSDMVSISSPFDRGSTTGLAGQSGHTYHSQSWPTSGQLHTDSNQSHNPINQTYPIRWLSTGGPSLTSDRDRPAYTDSTQLRPTGGVFKTGNGYAQQSLQFHISSGKTQVNKTLGVISPNTAVATGGASILGLEASARMPGSGTNSTYKPGQTATSLNVTAGYPNATTNLSAGGNVSMNYSTTKNHTFDGVRLNNYTLPNVTVISTTFHGPFNSTAYNSTLSNSTAAHSTASRPTFLSSMRATPKPSTGLSTSAFRNQTTRHHRTSTHNDSCSTLTINDYIQTTIVTYTIELNQTTTLHANASTPLPVLIYPPSACATETNQLGPIRPITRPGGGAPGLDPPPKSVTSVLLVTKKNPVVVRSPETVGPIFNVPTTAPSPATAQAAESPQPEQKPDSGSNSGSSAGKSQQQPQDHPEPGHGSDTSSSNTQPQSQGNPAPGHDSESSNGGSQVQPQQNPNSGQGSGSSSGSSQPQPQQNANSGQGSGSSSSSNQPQSQQQPKSGQVSGSSSSSSQSQSQQQPNLGQVSGSGGTSQSDSSGDPTPGSAQLHQEFPETAQSHSNAGQQNAATNEPGGTQGQSISNVGQVSGGSQTSGENRQTMPGGQFSGGSGQTQTDGQSLNGGARPGSQEQNPNGGVQVTTEGQTPGAVAQSPGAGQKPKAVGQMPGAGQSSNSGNYSPLDNGRISSGSAGSPSNSAQSNPGSQVDGAGADGPAYAGAQSQSGESGASDGSMVDSSSGSKGISGGGVKGSGPYVPKAVMIGGVPISIADAAIIVGSQTVSAGSPSTTIVANGQPITVDSNRIVAPQTTIPIEAAITSPPSSSTTIGGVPLVLQPNDVVIGSQTFSHSSSPAFAVYNGQTYSWDAKHLVGPDGSLVAFPSATSSIPQVTAGGQIFSVYPSFLKASGTVVNLPNTPSASPFVYDDRTYSVNPSQLIVPGSSITVPPITSPTPFVYKSQTFSIDNSQLIAPSATIPLTSGSGTVRYGTDVITVQNTQIVCPDTTIGLPGSVHAEASAAPSAITTGGLTFSIGPSAAIIGSSTYPFSAGQAVAINTDLGQPVTIDQSGVRFGSISVPTPTAQPSYSVVTQDGITLSVAASDVVIGGQTQHIQPSMSPVVTTVNCQRINIGPQGVEVASTTIPLPTRTEPSYSVVTQDGITFSVAASDVVIGGQTQHIQPGVSPVVTTVDGQRINIGPQGVEFASTTIPLPTRTTGYAVVTQGNLTISVAPSAAVVQGSTFAIGPDMPATVVVNGQTISVGPKAINFPGTTVDLPIAMGPQTPTAVTADGLTFSVGPTDAYIGGTAYAIGSGAVQKTVVVGSETILLGSNGVALASTTVPPEQTPSAVATANGVTISADASEAVIEGTTYAIGSEAIAKTVVVGSETIGLGTKGIVLSSSTIAPWRNALQTVSSSIGPSGTATASSSVVAAAAQTTPTGLPGTVPEAAKNNIHKGDAYLLRPPNILPLGVFGALVMGLVALL